MMISSCLEALRLEATRQLEVEESIQDALDVLSMQQEALTSSGEDSSKISADRYWLPFKLALAPTMPLKLKVVALNELQKLLAHKLLRGALPGEVTSPSSSSADNGLKTPSFFGFRKPSLGFLFQEQGDVSQPKLDSEVSPEVSNETHSVLGTALLLKSPSLIDEIIDCVIRSLNSPSANSDESLQLTVLKVLLTAMTSPECEVHELSLIRIYNCCFAISSTSQKNSTNEVTAKATLTQIVTNVFIRMERFANVFVAAVKAGSQLERLPKGNSFASNSALDNSALELTRSASNQRLVLTPRQSITGPNLPEHRVESTSDATEVPLETEVSYSQEEQESINPYNTTVAVYYDLLKRDVYLTLRYLFSMSMHSDSQKQQRDIPSLPSGSNPASTLSYDELSSHSSKTRILAMELVLSVLNNAGPVLKSEQAFTDVIKNSLCLSISRNALTTNPVLFELSFSTFLLVISHFRDRLKPEIEVLLSNIYLHILDMGNSSYRQKSIILQGLLKLCENPQVLVDMYVNYDCDMAMTSIFERIMTTCCKITQGRSESLPKPSNSSSFGIVGFAVGLDSSKNELIREQGRKIIHRALATLVTAVHSLNLWCRDKLDSASISPESSNPDLQSNASVNILHGSSAASDNGSTPSDAQDQLGQPNVYVSKKNPMSHVSMAATVQPDANSPRTTTAANLVQVASRKQTLREGVRLFSQKPKKGILYLFDASLLEDTPECIADFLLTTKDLNKSQIGEYIGEGDANNIKVMHVFIDSVDFTGMDLVAALRFLLQLFRLPGEAQKIDRIMEKFADRYCECNSGIFANADTAYTLAFSIMMLNTDQHSSQIKHRMDKPAFIKNNRGINDNGDLPDELLGSIFDEIAQNEIVMEEEQAKKLAQMAIGWGAGDLNDEQRLDLYKREVEVIQKKSQMLMQAATVNRVSLAAFQSAADTDLARPMFSMCCWALMASFSLLFESAVDDDVDNVDLSAKLYTTSEPRVTDLCLRGFGGAIPLACVFKLETERDAFISSLAKLTSMNNFSNMKPKNVKAVKTIIELANSLGEHLDSSWYQIMIVVSQLERLQVVASARDSTRLEYVPVSARPSIGLRGNRSIDGSLAHLADAEQKAVSDDSSNQKSVQAYQQQQLQKLTPAVEALVAELNNQSFVIVIDRIFTKSVNLSATAIIHFFKAICRASLEEVGIDSKGEPVKSTTVGPPRMYLLQKIVETAYYNLHRIRFEWTQIWRILQPHFSILACHSNQSVATFAVDSLRQLGVKLLEREELGHFSSQNEFMKSFEWIIKHTNSRITRELILSSLMQMIQARAASIRSGWKSIFVALFTAAQADSQMEQTSFNHLQSIFHSHFDEVVSMGGFVDLVSCLGEFALLQGDGADHYELVMGSIQFLQSCTKSLLERSKKEADKAKTPTVVRRPSGNVVNNQSAVDSAGARGASKIIKPQHYYVGPEGFVSEESFYLYWFPILSAFSRIIVESTNGAIRTHTLVILFDTLKTSGGLFAAPFWKAVHRNILSSVFEDLCETYETSGSREQHSAILIQSLRLLVETITQHFDVLVIYNSVTGKVDESSLEFLESSIARMVSMMSRKDEKLASSGQICLQQLLLNNAVKIAKMKSWTWFVDKVEVIFKTTTPVELLNCTMTKNSSPDVTEDTTSNATVEAEDSESKADMIIPLEKVVSEAKVIALSFGEPLSIEKLDFDHTIIKCVVHLEFLQTLRDLCLTRVPEGTSTVLAIAAMGPSDRSRILKLIYSSYVVARAFNSMFALRHAIWKQGWVAQMPNLVKQETVSYSIFIVLLFGCYKCVGDNDDVSLLIDSDLCKSVPDTIIVHTMDLLDRFTVFLTDPVKNQRDISHWSPIVMLIYKEILSMDGWWVPTRRNSGLKRSPSASNVFVSTAQAKPNNPTRKLSSHIERYFHLAIRMMCIDRLDVRNVLQEFLERATQQFVSFIDNV